LLLLLFLVPKLLDPQLPIGVIVVAFSKTNLGRKGECSWRWKWNPKLKGILGME